VEQLIPYDLRVHYSISAEQITPIQNRVIEPLPCHHVLKEKVRSGTSLQVCTTCRPVIEIPPDKGSTLYTANIRATLASNNLPSTSVKENKKLLESFAAINGKKVIYLKKDRYSVTEPVAAKEVNKKASFKIVGSKPTNS
jgi:hypothetical protein